MADIESAAGKVNIPRLDEKIFSHWSMRMKAHLRHLGLLKYVLEPAVPLSGASADAVAKKHNKTVDILMNYMTETVFESVITPENEDSPYGIWSNIVSCFASTTVNNKGRVWLKFIHYECKGDLAAYITNMSKMLNKISVCKLGVPDNILSFSILSKLSEDMYNVVNNIIMNKVICESPSATLTKLQEIVHLKESRSTKKTTVASKPNKDPPAESASALLNKSSKKGKKKNRRQGPICENRKHNEEVKSCTLDQCWQIHPNLKDKYPPDVTAVRQLSSLKGTTAMNPMYPCS
jgi:hypothetical protein